MTTVKSFVVFAVLLSAVSLAFAQTDPVIFPKEGQSKEQVKEDKVACQAWAEEETGLDAGVIKAKMELARQEAGTVAKPQEGRFFKDLFKGAATGAATGAIEQSIGNDIAGGAAKGTVLGGVFSHEKSQGELREQKIRATDIKLKELQDDYQTYLRAYTVCMEAKGYHVK